MNCNTHRTLSFFHLCQEGSHQQSPAAVLTVVLADTLVVASYSIDRVVDMNRRNFGDDVVPTNSNSREGASLSKGPNASSSSSRPSTTNTTQPVLVSDARTSAKSMLIPPSDALSVASSTNTNNSISAASGNSRRRGGKNRNNRSKKQQQQGENSSGNSNTPKDFGVSSSGIPAPTYGTKSNSGSSSSKLKKKTNAKWAQANTTSSDAAAQGKKSPSSSFHLPQMKLELRKVLHGHLKRYEKESSSVQQQLSNKEGEVDHRENTLPSQETVQLSTNAPPAEGGEPKEENDLTVKWLSPECKLKRQIACTNAQCMMLLIRDLTRGISATNIGSSTGVSPPTLDGENFFWNTSNIRFRLDQNSFQNTLWEWTYPPSIVPPTPLGFDKDDGLLWDTSSKGASSVVDELGDLLSKVAILEEKNNNKMDSAYVHVRILNLQPPRKSRRRGEVSGIVYFILSPDVNSIIAELKRQQNLDNFRSRQHLVSAAVSKPPVILTDVVVTSEEYATKLETSSLPENSFADHVASSHEVTASVELLPVDNTKVTAFARLILDSAVEKLRSQCTTLSPLLGLSISHNQKSFPEPKYHHQPIQPDNRRRRLRGETRLENTIEKSEDYLEFVKLYEANKGEVPMVLADEQQVASTRRVGETATTSSSTGGGTATEPPVAALVAHLQMKRREEEEKKALATKQRRAQLSKKSLSSVSSSKSTKGKGGTHTQAVSSLAQGTKASKPTTAGSRTSNTQIGDEAKGSKVNSRSKGGGNNKSKKKTLGGGGGTMNTAIVTTIIKPRAGSS